MSQTPKHAADQEADAYAEAWKTILRWTEEGRSWSGRERHCLFLNLDSERFADISGISGLDYAEDGRGAAAVDWDHDGGLDFWISARTAPQIRLLRNERPRQGRFVKVRLQAANANRDAIGARVTVNANGLPWAQTKTLRAGDGFLSQSSKWLHFGLADSDQIDSLEVTWPDGSSDLFDNLEVDQNYTIRQPSSDDSSAEIAAWSRPAMTPTFGPGEAKKQPSSDRYAQLVAQQPQLQRQPYLDRDGTERQVPQTGKPMLLMLWASWCQPCLVEMQAMAKDAAAYSALEIEVLALSVDGLGSDNTTFADAIAVADRISFPFAIGHATPELLDKLQALNNQLYMAKRPLPLPSSLLFDDRGRLSAITRGPLDLTQLEQQVAQLDLRGPARLAATLSRPGRWLSTPAISDAELYASQARRMLGQGDLTGAINVLQQAVAVDPDAPAIRLLLGTALVRQGQLPQAAAELRRATQLDPTLPEAHLQLGDVLWQQGQPEKARGHYERVLQIGDDPDAHAKLGVLAASAGQLDEAEVHFQAAAKLSPTSPTAWTNLGKVLLDQGKHAEAIEALQKTQAMPDPPLAASVNLAWLLATAEADELRNGEEALRLALLCGKRTQFRNAEVMDRIAAAYAELGNFEKALQVIDTSITLARRANNAALLMQLDERRQQYSEGRPFRLPARN